VPVRADGVGANARFNVPIRLACDPAGNVYVADRGNHSVRKITPTGVVSTIAGLSGSSGSVDGTGNMARFREPCGMTVDASGNVYVADTKNHLIRRAVVAGSSPTVQITSQPVIQITHVGQAVSFGVVATGSGALSYQWKRNGISIAGATSATYAIAVPASVMIGLTFRPWSRAAWYPSRALPLNCRFIQLRLIFLPSSCLPSRCRRPPPPPKVSPSQLRQRVTRRRLINGNLPG
jgi:hypothetical protein